MRRGSVPACSLGEHQGWVPAFCYTNLRKVVLSNWSCPTKNGLHIAWDLREGLRVEKQRC